MLRALWCWLFHRNWWFRCSADTALLLDRRGELYTILVIGRVCAQCGRAWSREYLAFGRSCENKEAPAQEPGLPCDRSGSRGKGGLLRTK